MDAGEAGIGGVHLTVENLSSGQTTDTYTMPDGSWSVGGLMPGKYQVTEDQPAGYLDGLDAAGTVNNTVDGQAHNPGDLIDGIQLLGGQSGLNYDFGELLPASVSGYVYVDANNNGVFDPGEAPIAGVQLTLLDASGKSTGLTAVTDSTGFYQFSNLAPGAYGVSEAQPAGYLDGLDAAGTVNNTVDGTAHNPGDLIDGITLASGQSGLNYDFGELLPASISGYVYVDANNNGVMDTGELGIGGVKLTVENVSTGETTETYTMPDGSWAVDGLTPGEYQVAEAQPAGYLDGLDAAGTVNNTVDGAAHNPGDLIDGITLASGQSGLNYDFGELLPASVSGYVYVDANNNGVFDPGETPIAGVTLTLLDASGKSTGLTAVTDSTGFYQFSNLAPGAYGVAEAQPAGYLDGLDAAGTVNNAVDGTAHNPGDLIDGISLASGQSGLNYDFGELSPASVSGYVYVDANNNGTFDPGETPIAGVTLTLLDASGKSTGLTAVTDSNGFYQFSNLTPGAYGVAEAQPAGYLDGLDAAGTVNNAVDGAAHNPGDLIDGIQLASGQSGLNYDFGELLPASISGYVYSDANNNGTFDPGEAPIAGAQLTLLDASGKSTGLTAVTDSNGFYQFSNLTPGTYGVSETQPAGYLDGLDTAGPIGGTAHNPGDLIDGIPLSSGTSAPDNDFGEIKPALISGYVFQDGPPIVVTQGETPDIPKLRDGILTSDDTRLSGVVLELCDASGQPLLDSHGNTITAVTDASGYYEFDNLKPNVYSVVEMTQPANYLPGIDTVGTTNGVADGLAFNSYTYQSLGEGTLSMLSALNSSSIAIASITLDAGDKAVSYNFSHVLVQTQTQPTSPSSSYPTALPPIPPMPPMASPLAGPFAAYQPMAHPYAMTPITLPGLAGGSGEPDGFSWHLSVIDAGQPRRTARAINSRRPRKIPTSIPSRGPAPT